MHDADLHRAVRLIVSESRTSATLRIDAAAADGEFCAEDMLALLDEKAVEKAAVDPDAVDRLVEAANTARDRVHEEVVASGIEPRHGTDGRFEFHPSISAQLEAIRARQDAYRARSRQELEGAAAGRPPDDDRDAIDFYECSAFVVVRQGDPIGKLVPPTEGVDGRDIFGEAAPARRGRRADVTLGPSLIKNSDGTIAAAFAGRLDATIDRVSVERTLAVRGSADFSTGNIRFPGDVTVDGGVRDRFLVEAGGDCVINDLVEAATLRIAGRLELRVGVAGRGKASVHTGGDLRTRYLDGVRGVVGGSLRFDREISGCDLRVLRRIEAPAGTILGGRIECAQRVDIAQVGGEGGVETVLALGRLTELDESAARVLALIEEIQPAIDQAAAELAFMQKNVAKPTPQQAEQLTELQFAVLNGREQLVKLGRAVETIGAAYAKNALTSLTARKAIHANTLLLLPGFRVVVEQPLRGGVLIDIGEDGQPRIGTIHGTDFKPLPARAKVTKDDSSAALLQAARLLGVELPGRHRGSPRDEQGDPPARDAA